MRCLAIFLVAVAAILRGVGSYQVLFVCGLSTKSHSNFYMGIVKELASGGHNVTVLTPNVNKEEQINENITQIGIPEADIMRLNQNRFNLTFTAFYHQIQMTIPICHDTLRKSEIQSLLREKFDVILMSPFSDCYLSLVHQLQVPFIYVSPLGMTANLAEMVGNPIFPSYATMIALDYTPPLTFAQRTKNLLAELAVSFVTKYFVNKKMEDECRRSGLCPGDMPPFTEIQQNVSLLFLNSVREMEMPPRPYLTSVIHLGGIHCRPAKRLPKELIEWADDSGEDGFIFFSLGTIVRSVDLPESHRQILVNTFASLKQRVLWKWDDVSIPGISPNVRVARWLPQQDILGHPRLQLFITHGGLLSTLESVYHGRPVLGMPVFGDQMGNMREVERQGWGKALSWDDLTEERLLQEILSVMDNKTMHEIVQSKSLLMRDRPMTPRDLVLFWTEYVIRHKGAAHLRCPIAQMPWYKVYNVDVWLMFVMWCVLLVLGLSYAILAILRFLRKKTKSKQD